MDVDDAVVRPRVVAGRNGSRACRGPGLRQVASRRPVERLQPGRDGAGQRRLPVRAAPIERIDLIEGDSAYLVLGERLRAPGDERDEDPLWHEDVLAKRGLRRRDGDQAESDQGEGCQPPPPHGPSARYGRRNVCDLEGLDDLGEVAGARMALPAVDQRRVLLRTDRLSLPAACAETAP